MGKNYFRNFLAPNPGICEVQGENHLGKIIFESDHIYPVLNDLEVSQNVNGVKRSIYVCAYNFRLDQDRGVG